MAESVSGVLRNLDQSGGVSDDGSRPSDPDPLEDTACTAVSTFDCLYESKDGKLACFQTEDGHLIAVDTGRLV